MGHPFGPGMTIGSRVSSTTTVVSLVLYTLAQAPERVVSASLGVTAP
jgi:hypothetical protein